MKVLVETEGRVHVHRFQGSHRKAEYMKPVQSNDFWFCELLDGSREENQERIIQLS